MSARLILICHGFTDSLQRAAFPLDDEELNARGRQEVTRAVPLLTQTGTLPVPSDAAGIAPGTTPGTVPDTTAGAAPGTATKVTSDTAPGATAERLSGATTESSSGTTTEAVPGTTAPLRGPAARRRDVVLCGPAVRCLQTAAGLGLTAVVDHGLRDRNAGRWAGRTLAEIQAREPEELVAWLTDPAAAPHDGESVLALIERVAAWLRTAHGEGGGGGGGGDGGGGRIIAVTHPDVIRAALVHVLGAPPETFWRIDAEPLTSVRLTSHAGRWRLRLPRPA
ncbi:histidine phosphatase family protein [Sphaerisporangium sp. NPDC005288]|uniref:histidine phosphatase family protein n=1 Tax=Sphaerisporangium sp. NPDC005288 TaxID=3155114 RepID=UPI0033A3758B